MAWCREPAWTVGPGGDDGDVTIDLNVDDGAGGPAKSAEDRPVGDAAPVVHRGHPVHGSVGWPGRRNGGDGQRTAR